MERLNARRTAIITTTITAVGGIVVASIALLGPDHGSKSPAPVGSAGRDIVGRDNINSSGSVQHCESGATCQQNGQGGTAAPYPTPSALGIQPGWNQGGSGSGQKPASATPAGAQTPAVPPPTQSAAPTGQTAPGPTATSGEYRYTYTLVQNAVIDLGSHSADHDQITSGSWTTQNFGWSGKDASGNDLLGNRGGGPALSVLASSAPATHEACQNSPRDNGDPAAGGLQPGTRICFFPGGFDALVTIVSDTATPGGSGGQLTVDVRVWT